MTHGSPELDADAAKLLALGADPGPTLREIDIEFAAQAFCEASGDYKWEDTPDTMKQWYRQGITAAFEALNL